MSKRTTLLTTVDKATAENFRLLEERLENNLLFEDFQVYDALFKVAGTDVKLFHSLGFLPQDVLVTRNVGNATVTFNYAKWTSTYIVASVSGPCTLRLLLGKFQDTTVMK